MECERGEQRGITMMHANEHAWACMVPTGYYPATNLSDIHDPRSKQLSCTLGQLGSVTASGCMESKGVPGMQNMCGVRTETGTKVHDLHLQRECPALSLESSIMFGAPRDGFCKRERSPNSTHHDLNVGSLAASDSSCPMDEMMESTSAPFIEGLKGRNRAGRGRRLL